jgi:hypothetical protein
MQLVYLGSNSKEWGEREHNRKEEERKVTMNLHTLTTENAGLRMSLVFLMKSNDQLISLLGPGVVECAYNPIYTGSRGRRVIVEGLPQANT